MRCSRNYDFSKGGAGQICPALRRRHEYGGIIPRPSSLFPDSESMNRALRALVEVAQRSAKV